MPGRSDPELMQHLARLKQEIADLKEYSERVTKELRSLQLKQASESSPTTDTATDGKDGGEQHGGGAIPARIAELPLPAWALDMQLMCPLLAAYDARIKDQQLLLERREAEVKSLADNVVSLTKENEALTNDLRGKTSQLQALFTGDGKSDGPGCSIAALIHEKEELEELYNVTKEQNEVLLNQNHLLKCHVEQCEQALDVLRCQAAEGEKQQASAAEVRTQNEGLQHLLNAAKMQLEECVEERDKLRVVDQHHKQGLAELKERCAQLQTQTEALQNQLAAERQAAQEAAACFEERDREKQQQFQSIEAELAELQDSFMQLSNQNHEAERETEKAREIIDYLESKTGGLERENEQVKNTLAELNQRFQEITIEKEKLSASSAIVQAQLDKIREQHSGELALQRTMLDERFESTTSQLQQQVEQLRQKVQELTASNADLTLRTEAAERRRKVADAEATQAQDELKSASRAHQTLVQQLQQTKISLEKERDKLKEDIDSLRSTTSEKVSATMAEKQRLESELIESRFALKTEEQAKRHLESSLDSLKRQVSDLSGKNATVENELQATRRRHDKEIDDLRRQYTDQLNQTEAKLRVLEQETRMKERQAVQLMKEEEELRHKITREHEEERSTLESKLSKLRSSNTLLRSKMLELVQSLEQPTPTKESLLCLNSSNDLGSLRSTCTRESLV
ncbi:non-muscle myosin ii heavy [Cystoisospora suis]|uniref:Non-muscle myosin ii heavy n=1 Tax=Cystoisospora suis TaxID=483139 RepID=A0A2C6KYI3_9APIC|nr:non-muscle myosin ii heavy [Cystoisospora suis]